MSVVWRFRLVVTRLILALVALLVFAAAGAAGQAGLVRAKELYSSAAYDDALAMLDGLEAKTPGSVEMEVEQYRALCLLALQRTDEATAVIEGMVKADPFYRINEAQASPRVARFFQEVRREALPAAVLRSFAEAKAALERKDPRATAQFDLVLALLNDPDMRDATETELTSLVTGFRDLSRAMAPPPPAPAAVVAPVPADLSARPGAGGESAAGAGAVSAEAGVTAALRAYEEAYSRLDAGAVIAVFPGLNGALLGQGFAQLKAQRLQILDPQVVVTGSTATVTCQVRQRYEPKTGRASETRVNATFRLQKRAGVWVIAERR